VQTSNRSTAGSRKLRVDAVFLLLLPLICACVPASGPSNVRAGLRDLEAIERLEPDGFGPADDVAEVDVLALTADMKDFARGYLGEFSDPNDQVQMLGSIITHPGGLGFQYDQAKTRTAREAFEYRTGNCLTLSNLYIALARYLGLDARYQEVLLGDFWTRSGDLYLLNRHINVTGRLSGGRSYVIDFIHIDAEYVVNAKVVPDTRAKAQYYNNIGAELLGEGDNIAALAYFKKALTTDSTVDYVWSNLGTAYSRTGAAVAAEASFKKSLELNAQNWSAVNNLAFLYRKLGRLREAERQLERIKRFRLKNPYYRYELSEEAYRAGRYDEAIAHLKKAIALKPQEHEFHFALARSYYRRGDLTRAQSQYEEARRLAASGMDATVHERYGKGLDDLFEEGDAGG
jgi:Flp pilus assembly protein TadD